jgi:hypothetical protein
VPGWSFYQPVPHRVSARNSTGANCPVSSFQGRPLKHLSQAIPSHFPPIIQSPPLLYFGGSRRKVDHLRQGDGGHQAAADRLVPDDVPNELYQAGNLGGRTGPAAKGVVSAQTPTGACGSCHE